MISIYLDQHHWISLLKASKNKEEHENISALLFSARELVQADAICFPISSINIMELARVGNQVQRFGLAALMVELSSGYVVPSPSNVIDIWLKYSIQKLIGFVPNPKPDLCPSKGLFSAFPPEAREEIKRASYNSNLPLEHLEYFPEVWLSYLSFKDESDRRRAIESITKVNREHNARMCDRRDRLKSEPENMKHRAYCALLALDQLDKIKAICVSIGADYLKIMHSGHEKALELITQVPFFDVEAKLHVVTEKQWSREFQENDWYDIGALSAAIPFCNFVFTERYWKSLILQKDIHLKYSTGIEDNIERLGGILENAA